MLNSIKSKIEWTTLYSIWYGLSRKREEFRAVEDKLPIRQIYALDWQLRAYGQRVRKAARDANFS